MERIVKIFLILCFISTPVFAATTPQPTLTTTTSVVTEQQCIKTFNVGFEKLFLLTEVAITSNNFTIEEIQSQGGYIVFSAGAYKFLATVFTFGNDKAILKITPCNGNYTFPPMIIRNIFNYISKYQYNKF